MHANYDAKSGSWRVGERSSGGAPLILSQATEISVGENKAMVQESHTKGFPALRQTHYYFVQGNTVQEISIQHDTTDTSLGALQATLDQILATFKFLDSSTSEGARKTYTDSKYAFSFTVPDGYFTEVKDFPENKERLVYIKKTDAPEFGYTLSIKNDWDNTGNAKDLARTITVGGVPAAKLDPPKKEERSLQQYQTNTYFEKNGNVFSFFCVHNWVENYVKTCDSILESFQFTK